jgi:hypothetical protein
MRWQGWQGEGYLGGREGKREEGGEGAVEEGKAVGRWLCWEKWCQQQEVRIVLCTRITG